MKIKRIQYLSRYWIRFILSIPHHPHLSTILFFKHFSLTFYHFFCNFLFSIKMRSTDRENAVVRFQHIIACPNHNGFRQVFRYKCIYTLADLIYFFFIHAHSPFTSFVLPVPDLQCTVNIKYPISILLYFCALYWYFCAIAI